MKRVLVTGAAGQIGRELARAPWPEGFELVRTDSSDLDITDPHDVDRVLAAVDPDLIVNAAGYTAVDRAEDEPERAFAVNEGGVGYLAAGADDCNATLIHLSTDYVFDGSKDGWYVEDDVPRPLSVYGASKLAGERCALRARKALVLRTSWIYGALRPNFVVTMRRLAAEGSGIGVVADQIGCPTAARDVAAAIVEIARSGASEHGLFHVAAPDDASWWDVASEAIRRMDLPQPPTIRQACNRRVHDRRGTPEEFSAGLDPDRTALRYTAASLAGIDGCGVGRTQQLIFSRTWLARRRAVIARDGGEDRGLHTAWGSGRVP